MWQTEAIIIGGGQAGLAMSHCLSERGIDHVVLERGRVAERWHGERWDSLRLLTPNWMTRLPGRPAPDADPDGFMTKRKFITFLEQYASIDRLPVVTGATVRSVRPFVSGYRVESSKGTWYARSVVIATGYCDVPFVPAMARDVPSSIGQLTACGYRNPAELPPGGVLIVGASASGAQLARELRRSGREVIISAGRHTRLPRLYRGRDIMWWLSRPGIMRKSAETQVDLDAARSQPSMQLVGGPDRANLDLGTLRDIGVRIVGRARGISDGVLHARNDLSETVGEAQTRLERLLARIDASPEAAGAPAETWPAAPALDTPTTALDLAGDGITSVIWATGFRRDYRWLQVPVLDPSGEIVHRGGVTQAPGLYVTGLRLLRRWNPSFIDAVSADATELAAELQHYLHGTDRVAA